MIKIKSIPIALVVYILILSGCTISTKHVPQLSEKESRQFYIFLDGTANDAGSRTNVAKLHNLITLQNDPTITTIYIDGVGTQTFGKVLGLGTGLGNAKRVQEAYRFLAENYKEGDKIYVFGFSRGAWSARILSSLIYVAGVPDLMHLPESEREDAVDDIYYTYKKFWSTILGDDRTLQQRRSDVQEYLSKEKMLQNHKKNVNIDFLGLWDTVQALGILSLDDTDVGEPNDLYADQLCNIRQISHAVSLDDYRFEEFTPLLFRQSHFVQENCIVGEDVESTKPIIPIINEVWFSGAHSDVGGGYEDTTIEGISLNWMLSQMSDAKIATVNNNMWVYANHLDKTHNANSGGLDLIYNDLSRSLSKIYQSEKYLYPEEHLKYGKNITVNKGKPCPDLKGEDSEHQKPCYEAKIKLHPSVLDRLCAIAPKHFESQWFRDTPFKNCVVCDAESGSSVQNCKNIFEIEEDPRYKRENVRSDQNMCKVTDCELNDKTGRDNNPVKSCNLSIRQTKDQAKQRLIKITLDGIDNSRVNVTYFSDRKNDNTGVTLKSGLTYRLTIDEVNSWSDCTYSSDLNGRGIWDKQEYKVNPFFDIVGKGLQMMAKPYSQYPFEQYTTLIGRVNDHSFKFYKIIGDEKFVDQTRIKSGLFSVPEEGELVLTVNEPLDPDIFGFKYFDNNEGYVKFTLEVVDEAR